ncbi:MAG: extracellular solute-binding protein, partial [bacterium]|nr:extracellular solute-binding protein [bacterium]
PEEVVVTTLDYWGLWEPSDTLSRVLREFEASNPGISVNYSKQSIDGYRERLQTAIATANGPDLFRYHASWQGYLNENLATLPSSVMSATQFATSFYPVAAEQLTDTEGNIKGIPLMYDSLALLYNKDMYTEAGLEVPKTWTQFSQNARKLTKYEKNGYIAVSGAAFGLADNVDFASDIIGMLAVQSGADLSQPSSAIIADVLTFYTNFYNSESQRVWDTTFDNSTMAFARGETAMIFAPSWLIHDILAINPNLNIGVASVPQLNTDNPVEWATYWTEGVNNNSPRKEAAWKLLEYLSSESVLTQLYKEQASARLFGEIYPRPAMADLLASNTYLQPYLLNARNAVGYPLNDKTFDEALDDANKAITVSVINELTTGKKRSTAAELAVDLVEQWQENAILF